MNLTTPIKIVDYDNQSQHQLAVRTLIVHSFAAKFEALVRLAPTEIVDLLGAIWVEQGNSPSGRQFIAMDGNQVVGVLGLKWCPKKNLQIKKDIHHIPLLKLCKQYGLRNVCMFMVGMIALEYKPSPHECYIEHLAVASSHRKRGIARQLLITAQQFANQHLHCKYISLHVSSKNTPAIHLYNQMNFRGKSSHTSPFRNFLFREPEWIFMISPISDIEEVFHCSNIHPLD
ncbi:N-acetyltransferase [Paenibacillus sp. OK003]|uniref:GNAT family N-acetyltransferase n=1 Tax=Paenibacillus sp. OK003 TaxID=1884380 RepID=UPI0008C44228|nr:GNAT family N-acetyltransferase [Paenibacillus sp. OK003]SEK77304.1 Acetyltransferase (GNAT) family protein [Paenibacillus sp. OK003]